jgi:hypothetical protein
MKARFAWLLGLMFVAACEDATLESPRTPGEPDVEDVDDAAPSRTEDAGTHPVKGDAGRGDDARPSSSDAGTPPIKDAAPDVAAIRCTTTFGTAVSPSHGRLDGTVRAVILPGDTMCPSDNDHVIVQIDSSGGAYPVWINVESNLPTTVDKVVRVATPTLTLPFPAWSNGWHGGLSLDYPSLGLHSTASFTPMAIGSLGALIVSKVPVGARVSAYAYGFNTLDGAHKVHRNLGGDDGALVVLGTGTPTWLAFHFAGQSF